ncbi:MAG: HIT domain-containing protein [Lysobacteraceae bacterium]|nr:MAG: HIT domain-containing protein [Xanthomonadaceae bacterium]
MSFSIDPRLAAESWPIGELPLSSLLLMDDARYPWLLLVPRIAGARELLDLDEADRAMLLGEVSLASRALETLFSPDKLNIAALGNVVPQLHVHVLARYRSDEAWPHPVWGRGTRVAYEAELREQRIATLRGALKPGA